MLECDILNGKHGFSPKDEHLVLILIHLGHQSGEEVVDLGASKLQKIKPPVLDI